MGLNVFTNKTWDEVWRKLGEQKIDPNKISLEAITFGDYVN